LKRVKRIECQEREVEIGREAREGFGFKAQARHTFCWSLLATISTYSDSLLANVYSDHVRTESIDSSMDASRVDPA